MVYTKPHDRPECPAGHDSSNINKWGLHNGHQKWFCYLCRKVFFHELGDGRDEATFSLPAPDPTECPRCGSGHIEKEEDGTWVCWSCDWFQESSRKG